MLSHRIPSLDSVAIKNRLLEIGAEKEREELEANHTIQLFKREAV